MMYLFYKNLFILLPQPPNPQPQLVQGIKGGGLDASSGHEPRIMNSNTIIDLAIFTL